MLVLTNISRDDSGLYVCFASVTQEMRSNNDEAVIEGKQQENENNINSIDNSDNLENNVNLTATQAPILLIVKTATSSASSSSSSSLETSSVTTTTSPMLLLPNNNTNSKHEYNNNNNNTKIINNNNIPTKAFNIYNNNNNKNANNKALANDSYNNNNTNYYYYHNNTYNNLINSSSSTSSSSTRKTIKLISQQEQQQQEEIYQAFEKHNLTVRSPPGPVTQLYFKASTILGFLIWRFNKSNSNGYPLHSFTAEYRNVSYREQPYNSSFEHEWIRMDPINIAPNVVSQPAIKLKFIKECMNLFQFLIKSDKWRYIV